MPDEVMPDYMQDFVSRSDVMSYGVNALMLYALMLRFGIDDITDVASSSLTDSKTDNKADLIYINESLGTAVIAQSYSAQDPKSKSSPSINKVDDLSIAVSWVLNGDIDTKSTIYSQSLALRNLIGEGKIETLEVWFVHNIDERKGGGVVKKRLETVKRTCDNIIESKFKSNPVNVIVEEIAPVYINKMYEHTKTRIQIHDKISVRCPFSGYEISNGSLWRAYQTTISGSWLKTQYTNYGDKLFSGNIRDFLGAKKRKSEINTSIVTTIKEECDNFWVYNNGISALVDHYEIIDEHNINIYGLTIINGAQTTGCIGTSLEGDKDIFVAARFIVCKNNNILGEITDNNNRQNDLLPSDFRSNDPCQNRLRKEFEQFDNVGYSGGRRSSFVNNGVEINHFLIGQLIYSFHYDPGFAYNNKTPIWNSNSTYEKVFNKKLTPEHMIFLFSLSKSIDLYKAELRKKETLNSREEKSFQLMKNRGFKFLIVNAVRTLIISCATNRINEEWSIRLINSSSPLMSMQQSWIPILRKILPMLNNAAKDQDINGLKKKSDVDKTIKNFEDRCDESLEEGYDDLFKFVEYN